MARLSPRVPSGLRGSYHPRTDHLEFSARLPDEFPDIDFTVRSPDEAEPLAVLVEEFLHRCQWALTAVGVVYRVGCLVQVDLVLQLLQHLGRDRRLRLPAPWLAAEVPADPHLAAPLGALRALETMQRLLLGTPLDVPRDALHDAVQRSKDTLTAASPLVFGTFGLWAPDQLYDESGRPVLKRTTRGVAESHASAYAVELLRGASRRKAAPWLDAHVATNRRGLYLALEELAASAETPAALDPASLLRLADWALACPFTHVTGVPPPPDYLDSALPYSRYALAVEQLPLVRDAARRVRRNWTPSLRELVELVISARGDIRPGFVDVPPDRSAELATALRSVQRWTARRIDQLDVHSGLGAPRRLVTHAIGQAVSRYLTALRDTPRDGYLFQPVPERFAWLCGIADHPVIAYPDRTIEVFCCEPTYDYDQVAQFQGTVWQLSKAARQLVTGHLPSDEQMPPDDGRLDAQRLLEWAGVSASQIY